MKLIDVSTAKHPNHFAMVDDEDFDRISQWKWHVVIRHGKGTKYACRTKTINGRIFWFRMHREVIGVTADICVDHRDGNGLNNTRDNLRTATVAENNRNVKKPKHGRTSRFKGVSWEKREKKFRAQIKFNKKRKRIGTFRNEEDAAWAYDREARRIFGAFAYCNFPPPPMVIPGGNR